MSTQNININVENRIRTYRGLENYVKRVVQSRRREIYADMAQRVFRPYVPYDPSNQHMHLRDSFVATDTGVQYTKPYAKSQYEGVDEITQRIYKHWTTPGTGPYWDEVGAENHTRMINNIVKKHLVRKG